MAVSALLTLALLVSAAFVNGYYDMCGGCDVNFECVNLLQSSGDDDSGSGSGSGEMYECVPCPAGTTSDGFHPCSGSSSTSEPETTTEPTTPISTASSSSAFTMPSSTRSTIATSTMATSTTKAPAWGEWSSYGPCNAQCGVSHKTRTRVCVGGSTCVGESSEKHVCNVPACYTTVVTYNEIDYDTAFGTPVDETKVNDFINSFKQTLSSVGIDLSTIETISVSKSPKRADPSGVDVKLTYAPEAFTQLEPALGSSVPLTYNGQSFAGTPVHTKSSSSSGSSDSSNTAVIVGAVVGSVAGVGLIALAAVGLKKRSESKSSQNIASRQVEPIPPVTTLSDNRNEKRLSSSSIRIENPSYEYHV